MHYKTYALQTNNSCTNNLVVSSPTQRSIHHLFLRPTCYTLPSMNHSSKLQTDWTGPIDSQICTLVEQKALTLEALTIVLILLGEVKNCNGLNAVVINIAYLGKIVHDTCMNVSLNPLPNEAKPHCVVSAFPFGKRARVYLICAFEDEASSKALVSATVLFQTYNLF